MSETISSLQNSRIKNILSLQKASARKDQGICTVEGYRELRMAISGGFETVEFYYCPEIAGAETEQWIQHNLNKLGKVFLISRPVFERIAYRESTEGIYALIKPRRFEVSGLQLSPCPLLLVLESVEKPGNLGAVLRTADAAGLDAVIICDPHTDIYNPNVIRSSIGAVFTLPVVSCSSDELMSWLEEKHIKSAAAIVDGSSPYHEADFTQPTAIILGTESTGLSKLWIEKAGERIRIPMLGKMDSLNVSTSAAILVYEAMRQRGFAERK